MSKQSASVSALEKLHAATAEYLTSRLEASTSADEDDDFIIPLSTGEVTNIITFLKHNNISATPDDEVISGLKTEFDNDLALQRKIKAEQLTAYTDAELEQQDWLH